MGATSLRRSMNAPSPEPTTSAAKPPEPAARPWWHHLRAAFVLFHLFAMCALATPDLGGGLSRKAWKQATVQRELKTWAGRFGEEPEAFEERIWGIALGYTRWRERLLWPVQPYKKYFGVRQRWRMFAAPDRRPARYEIDIRQDGEWKPIYRSRSDEHAWRRRLFDHDRMRNRLYRATWPNHRRLYRRFCNWVAYEAAHDFPEASKVRVRRFRYDTPAPDDRSEPEGRYEGKCIRSLEKRR
jgi:hypothetical protein